jgi:hypothetical protein
MNIAFGGKYDAKEYFMHQVAAGVALRMASPEFRYGMFPAIASIVAVARKCAARGPGASHR